MEAEKTKGILVISSLGGMVFGALLLLFLIGNRISDNRANMSNDQERSLTKVMLGLILVALVSNTIYNVKFKGK